jgi:hypothetical protein
MLKITSGEKKWGAKRDQKKENYVPSRSRDFEATRLDQFISLEWHRGEKMHA